MTANGWCRQSPLNCRAMTTRLWVLVSNCFDIPVAIHHCILDLRFLEQCCELVNLRSPIQYPFLAFLGILRVCGFSDLRDVVASLSFQHISTTKVQNREPSHNATILVVHDSTIPWISVILSQPRWRWVPRCCSCWVPSSSASTLAIVCCTRMAAVWWWFGRSLAEIEVRAIEATGELGFDHKTWGKEGFDIQTMRMCRWLMIHKLVYDLANLGESISNRGALHFPPHVSWIKPRLSGLSQLPCPEESLRLMLLHHWLSLGRWVVVSDKGKDGEFNGVLLFLLG